MRGDGSMDRVILIKYGELSTKKGNRNFFINTLYNDLKNKLKNYSVKIHKDRARMYIEFNESDLNVIKELVDKTFGIHTYHIAYDMYEYQKFYPQALLLHLNHFH